MKIEVWLVAFLLLATIAFPFLMGKGGLEKRIIMDSFVASDSECKNFAFVINGRVDGERLQKVSRMPYGELKSRLGVESDFEVYLVDGQGGTFRVVGKSFNKNS